MRERLVAFIVVCALACGGVAFARPGDAPTGVAHYEYVAGVGRLYVYSIDTRPSLVGSFALPGAKAIRGIGASAATGMLYVSYGGFPKGSGHLLEFSLSRRKIVYAHRYPFGIDSFDISHDGRLIFMPTGENTTGATWHLNLSRDGRYLLVGNAGNVIDTRTHKTVATLGALASSRYNIEIDRSGPRVCAAYSRESLGYVHVAAPCSARTH